MFTAKNLAVGINVHCTRIPGCGGIYLVFAVYFLLILRTLLQLYTILPKLLVWKIKTCRRRNFFYFDGLNLTDSMSHCNEIWIYVFPEKELPGLSPVPIPTFMRLWAIYTYIPRIGPHI